MRCLTEQQRALLRDAAIPVLVPAHAITGQVRASAQTTTRGGATVLSAFTVRLEGDGSAVPALRVAFGRHAVTWADLPAQRVGFVAYGGSEADALALTTCRA